MPGTSAPGPTIHVLLTYEVAELLFLASEYSHIASNAIIVKFPCPGNSRFNKAAQFEYNAPDSLNEIPSVNVLKAAQINVLCP